MDKRFDALRSSSLSKVHSLWLSTQSSRSLCATHAVNEHEVMKDEVARTYYPLCATVLSSFADAEAGER